jgi:hypothetical protein
MSNSDDDKPLVEAEDAVRRYLMFLEDPRQLVDKERVDTLEQEVARATDPIARLKALAELERAKRADGEGVKLGFIVHAKTWAEANEVPRTVFQQVGVPDEVLRAAGFDVGRMALARRTPEAAADRRSRRRALPVRQDEIKRHVIGRTEPFKLVDVTAAIGGSPATVRAAVESLVEQGKVTKLGPDPSHDGIGRAPIVYAPA